VTDLLIVITGLAEELVDARQHREPIYEWSPSRHRRKTGEHITVQPGLLAQLRDAIYEGPATAFNIGAQTSSTPAGSKPPLLLEALAHHIAITMAANRWIWELRITNLGAAEANIRTLVGAAATIDLDARRALASDMRRWRNWAAVSTGWANPPLTPRVPCPNPDCGQLSTLRILPEHRAAHCTRCGNVWDDTDNSIQALAEWVTHHTDNPMPRVRLTSSGGYSRA
jgi:hypothetical protein